MLNDAEKDMLRLPTVDLSVDGNVCVMVGFISKPEVGERVDRFGGGPRPPERTQWKRCWWVINLTYEGIPIQITQHTSQAQFFRSEMVKNAVKNAGKHALNKIVLKFVTLTFKQDHC